MTIACARRPADCAFPWTSSEATVLSPGLLHLMVGVADAQRVGSSGQPPRVPGAKLLLARHSLRSFHVSPTGPSRAPSCDWGVGNDADRETLAPGGPHASLRILDHPGSRIGDRAGTRDTMGGRPRRRCLQRRLEQSRGAGHHRHRRSRRRGRNRIRLQALRRLRLRRSLLRPRCVRLHALRRRPVPARVRTRGRCRPPSLPIGGSRILRRDHPEPRSGRDRRHQRTRRPRRKRRGWGSPE